MTDPPTEPPAPIVENGRRLLDALVARRPALAEGVQVTETEMPSWEARICSPTGDKSRDLVLWIAEDGVPSLDFSTWHTHGDLETRSSDLSEQIRAIVTIALAVLDDQFGVVRDIGGKYDGLEGAIDLRDPDIIADLRSAPHAPPARRIITFSGTGDRELRRDEERQP